MMKMKIFLFNKKLIVLPKSIRCPTSVIRLHPDFAQHFPITVVIRQIYKTCFLVVLLVIMLNSKPLTIIEIFIPTPLIHIQIFQTTAKIKKPQWS